MPASGYEFYPLVFDSISHSFAALTREISSWTLKDKIHIHARSCNILYLANSTEISLKPLRISSIKQRTNERTIYRAKEGPH